MLDMKTPAVFGMWVLGSLVVSIVGRIGWEIGGRLWGAF